MVNGWGGGGWQPININQFILSNMMLIKAPQGFTGYDSKSLSGSGHMHKSKHLNTTFPIRLGFVCSVVNMQGFNRYIIYIGLPVYRYPAKNNGISELQPGIHVLYCIVYCIIPFITELTVKKILLPLKTLYIRLYIFVLKGNMYNAYLQNYKSH